MFSRKLIKFLNVAAMVAAIVAAACAVLEFVPHAENRTTAPFKTPTETLSDDAADGHSTMLAQNQTGNCNAHVEGNVGQLNLNCSNASTNTSTGTRAHVPTTSPPGTTGRWRNTEFIPDCPPGKAFSREQNQCLNVQFIGGVIPCSPDDPVVCRR